MLGHIGMTAGLKTAWSSTDGIVVQGEMTERGDYSGPAGARAVLSAPGLELGILETARGGMLLKGMGVATNDVSVVTNVSADHLGLQGIDTVDQLAEVKAIVTGPRSLVAGRCSTATTRGSGPCGRSPEPSRGCSRCARLPGGSRVPGRGRARHHRPGRRHHGARVRARPRPPRQRPRRPGDAVGPEPAQHRQRPRRRRRGPRTGAASGRGHRGAAHVRPRRAAQPGPDERLHDAQCRRRRDHGHRRPGPQRGRPRGPAGRCPRPACPRGPGAPGTRAGR